MSPQGLLFLERWWLRGGLFLLPLAFSPQTYDSYVLPKLLVARTLLLGLVVLQVLRAAADGRLNLKRTSLDIPLGMFAVSALISTALAHNVNTGVFGTYSRYDGLLTTITYFGLFWFVVQSLQGPEDARGLLRALLADAYVFGLLVIGGAISDAATTDSLPPQSATLGNANVAGTFLAMALPLALFEFFVASSWTARLLALNAVVVIGVALAFTFSRSSWFGLAVALLWLLVGWRMASARVAIAAIVVGAVGFVLVAGLQPGPGGLERELGQRLTSVFNQAGWGSRPHIWRDSLSLVSSRPLLGYGPDNFGLVYPGFQTGEWERSAKGDALQIDKAHAETLQVAATQGLVGVAAYLLILVMFVRSFWRSRRDELAVAAFGAVVAYQVALQVNFTALGSALPFWIMAGAAMTIWEVPSKQRAIDLSRRPIARVAGATSVAAAALALAALLVAAPYAADSSLREAVAADAVGDIGAARQSAARARELVPYESVYEVEVGNIAFEMGMWTEARSAYRSASALGTYNPLVLRNLALVDIRLGRTDEALEAARQALALNPFDPANRALVDQLAKSRNHQAQSADS